MQCVVTLIMATTTKVIWLLMCLLPSWAWAATCRDLRFENTSFTVCTVDPPAEQLSLFLYRRDGLPMATFKNVADSLSRQGKQLSFAMNAGMYHADRSPVGLYIEDGRQLTPLITSDGPGNFGLLPNGVLCLTADSASVVESRRFAQARPHCTSATQSGPMLVIDNKLHPLFLSNSNSRYVRNGVGVSSDQVAHFAISNSPVTFHMFARLFRDVLKTPQALYFDGNISRLHAPALDRSDPGFPMGPIIGVVE